ncbi:FAD-binding protein [Sinomonas cyclohexanicum]|uniref:FAD-binding protein n=1 Tax=Sinomonas cyclohexanicum TaxID=322009 RepID=A0ABM7Q0S7_SINCY|nr:FAD-dependent oxidoreductase [Corynebacterium cyclohexanicum]BCT78174.1 FAD-binding protein [Corynebacterium cyclohexanicum]
MSFLTPVDALDEHYDLAVMGSGAAGLVAACRAAATGLRVVVLEKATRLGGTSAAGGGVIWAPDNPLAAPGLDSPDAAAAYLRAATGGAMTEEEIDWYLRTSRAAVDFLDRETHVRLTPLSRPDYHMEWPGAVAGGRSLDNDPFDPAHFPGVPGLAESLRPPTYLPLISMNERDHLHGAAPDPELLARRAASGVRTMGGALVGALVATAVERGVDLAVSAPVTGLEPLDVPVEGGDAHDGARWLVRVGGGSPSRATAGAVLIASGGFERNAGLAASLLRFPTTPIGAPSNTGDGLLLGLRAGAMLAQTGAIWGVPVIAPEDREYEGAPTGRMGNVEMTLPGSITVNAAGKRFVNEAMNYHDLSRVFANVDPATSRPANDPAWLVFDATYHSRYPVAGNPAGTVAPWMHRAESLADLAEAIGIDAGALAATVRKFNADARAGVDSEFGRGSTEQDRHLGDPAVGPNPCLAPLEIGPFFAVRIRPGALGTAGGLAADLDGRVLTPSGEPIPGLYAAGNCSATVFKDAYPGGGATLGSAVTRAFAAAEHIVSEHAAERTAPGAAVPA